MIFERYMHLHCYVKLSNGLNGCVFCFCFFRSVIQIGTHKLNRTVTNDDIINKFLIFVCEIYKKENNNGMINYKRYNGTYMDGCVYLRIGKQ